MHQAKYLPASFKGQSFNVDSSSDEFGRRGDLYEYPLGEETAYKDLGRKARRFRVEGYLIGGDQIDKTVAMARVAESPEPGTLMHPIYGTQLVACVTFTTTAKYRRDQRRTKLQFEFLEANKSDSPFVVGQALSQVLDKTSSAVETSKDNAIWDPTDETLTGAGEVSSDLGTKIQPATDEASFDAIDKLSPGGTTVASASGPTPVSLSAAPRATPSEIEAAFPYSTFRSIADPIDEGTATLRRIHIDTARIRLREFNKTVVRIASDPTPSIQSLAITARLSLIRDFALAVIETQYRTLQDALADLDFVMQVYDEEERAANATCNDGLTVAIRAARASAAQAILNGNIRLPGVVEMDAVGIWPSLVVAHKVYFDGRRHVDIENYNPNMSPFFIGRDIIAQAVQPGA